MESLVLNFLGFQLAAPTTKKFLRYLLQLTLYANFTHVARESRLLICAIVLCFRRFVQAAQASYEVDEIAFLLWLSPRK